MYADKQGFLYIETSNGVFHVYDIKNNKFEFYYHEGGFNHIYPFHTIYEDKQGLLWIGGLVLEDFILSTKIKYLKKILKILWLLILSRRQV